MANAIYGTIKIETAENSCFYHVLGDCVEYGDLASIAAAHPDLEKVIDVHRFELERALLQQKELLGIE